MEFDKEIEPSEVYSDGVAGTAQIKYLLPIKKTDRQTYDIFQP